ncbi:RNA polymerase II transcription mediator complex subunit 9-domain-containing protein [Xylaria sp. FL1042]|nr:RNA polymerase II transcription mediator complex subunit 9-domain-containing protein [Xylaria sp. FL1042]
MSPTQQQQPAPLPLPEALNPDAFDVLSELAHLLTRLRALPTTAPSTAAPTTGATPSQSTTTTTAASGPAATPTPTALLSSHATAVAAAASSSSSRKNGGGGELSLKEIPVATDALRHRFQRARTLVKTALPDLDRDVAAQEVEIAALEARIARQRDTLAKLREVGERLAVVRGEGEGDKMEE